MAARARPRPARRSAALAFVDAVASAWRPWLVAARRRARTCVLAVARAARARRCRRSTAGCVLDPLGQGWSSASSACSSSSARSTRPATWRCAPSAPTASSARACSPSSATMTLGRPCRTTSASCGWRIEATTLASAPLHLLQPQPALARGDLEVPADRLGRHRAGAARLVLPRLLGAARRASSSSLLFDDLVRDAPAPLAALAARRLRPAVRRLRHQDGPRADAHLEARRLRRGARAGRRAARRRPDQLRLPRDPALLSRSAAPPARRPSPASCMVVHRPALDGASPASSWRASATSSACSPTRASSTWASSCSASGIGGAGDRSARCCTWSTTASTKGVLFLSAGNIHRAYGSKRTDDVRGALRRVPVVGRALPGRLLRHHRLAAVRPLPERVHHPARRRRERPLRRRRRCSCCCSSSSSSAWARPCSRSCRASRPRGRRRPRYRDSFLTVGAGRRAPRPGAAARRLHPAAARARCCATRPRFVEAQP